MKIVSLLPSTTEICYALGLADQLAAVTHECDFPPAAQEKPHATRNVLPAGVTDSAEIDRLVTERVVAGLPIYDLDVPLLERLEPDLMLTQQLCEVCAVSYDDVLAVAEQLPKRPKVVSIEPTSVDDVLGSIRRVGALTQRAVTADAATGALRGRIDYIRRQVERTTAGRPRVVCLEWLDPPMVGGHWVPEMVELAGGQEMLGRARKPSFQVEWRQVLEADPEILVLMPCGYGLERTVAEAATLSRYPELGDLPAVRDGRVYAVDGSSYFNRPGPRLVGGIEILARIFHPEAAGLRPPSAAQPVHLRSAGAVR